MPFDPNQPAPNSPNSSAVMRAQLNALNDKIDAIPAGPQGPPGNDGEQGPPGADGNPGEVTNAALADAIATTARNPVGIATLDTPFADPDAESLRVAYNALVTALFRSPT